jgi:hypothetical protein
MKKLSLIILIVPLVCFTGCASYQISSSSLSGQLTGNTVGKGYLLATNAVKGNDLKSVKCIDKNGREKQVSVTNRTGVRITKTDNSKTTFYFNTLLIQDSSIVGSRTHFFNDKVEPIKLSDIAKIEIIE